MGIEALALLHAQDPAVFSNLDLAFRCIDFQRRTMFAGSLERAIRSPERLEDRFEQTIRLGVRRAINRGLSLCIGQLGGRSHPAAHKAVRALIARFVEDHAHGHAGPLFMFPQRTQIVGEALGQHRNDSVRQIDRIGPLQCTTVER